MPELNHWRTIDREIIILSLFCRLRRFFFSFLPLFFLMPLPIVWYAAHQADLIVFRRGRTRRMLEQIPPSPPFHWLNASPARLNHSLT